MKTRLLITHWLRATVVGAAALLAVASQAQAQAAKPPNFLII